MDLSAVTHRLGRVVEHWGGHLPPVTWATDTDHYARAMMRSGASKLDVLNTIAATPPDGSSLFVGPKVTAIVERLATDRPVGPADAALAVRTLSHEFTHVTTPLMNPRASGSMTLAEGVAEYASTDAVRLGDVARALGLTPDQRLLANASRPMWDLHAATGLIADPAFVRTHPYDRLHAEVREIMALAGDDTSRDTAKRFHGGTLESVRAQLVDDLLTTHGVPATEANQRRLDEILYGPLGTRFTSMWLDDMARAAAGPVR